MELEDASCCCQGVKCNRVSQVSRVGPATNGRPHTPPPFTVYPSSHTTHGRPLSSPSHKADRNIAAAVPPRSPHPPPMSDGSSTLNIPQLLVLAVVSFLVFRWYNSSSSSSPARAPASRNAGPRVNPAAVEQIAQMFPQLDRRHIAWDLQRNGSNVAGTTERILSGRGLEVVSSNP